jgi:hypothetical protein
LPAFPLVLGAGSIGTVCRSGKQAGDDAGTVPLAPVVLGIGAQCVPVEEVVGVVALPRGELAQGVRERRVSLARAVDGKLGGGVEEVVVGEADVEQAKLLVGPARTRADYKPRQSRQDVSQLAWCTRTT